MILVRIAYLKNFTIGDGKIIVPCLELTTVPRMGEMLVLPIYICKEIAEFDPSNQALRKEPTRRFEVVRVDHEVDKALKTSITVYISTLHGAMTGDNHE
jgi:hypothetical protein